MPLPFRLLLTCALATLVVTLNAQGVTKETVPGVTNFTRVETTIACAGATTPAAVAGIKKMGMPRLSTSGRRASRARMSKERQRRHSRPASTTCIFRSMPRHRIRRWSTPF